MAAGADSPPTLARGRCVVGCHDGWVYCLRLADGALAWRRRLARSDRRIVAHGQVESAWPVIGSVPVEDGRVFACAGRFANYAGNLWFYALDLADGKVLWEQRRLPATGYQLERPALLAIEPGGVLYQPHDWLSRFTFGGRVGVADGQPVSAATSTAPSCQRRTRR